MTGYESLLKMYPEWFTESPVIIWIGIFLLLLLFLIIPYIYVNFIEERLTILLRKARWKISFNYNKILHRVRPH